MISRDSEGRAPIEEAFGDIKSRVYQLQSPEFFRAWDVKSQRNNLQPVIDSIFHYRPEEGIQAIDQTLQLITETIAGGPPKLKITTHDGLFNDGKGVKTDLQDRKMWNKELIFYQNELQRLRETIAKQNHETIDNFRIATSLTVEGISTLLKGAVNAGLIQADKPLTQLYSKAAANFTSKGTVGSISTNSIKKHYENPTQRSKQEVVQFLLKTIEAIKGLPPEK